MKTAIALRHIHFEDLGTCTTVLSEHGYGLRYFDPTLEDLDDPAVSSADLLVVLGGPIGACDEQAYPFLAHELAVVRRRLETGRPLLGICLGAQLIARARGAKVYPLGSREIGFSPLALTPAGQDSVLAGLGDAAVLHWHGDQFDIPDGAVWLASTPAGAHQAFSIGPNVLGLQFHLEADVRQIERWLVGHACELAQAGIDLHALRADAARHGDRLACAARRVLADWLRHLDHQGASAGG